MLLRVLPVFIIFISGLINMISAISPALPARIEILEKLLPTTAILVSNFMVFIIGVLLIILAVYLLKGVKKAWRIALFLLILSAFGHLVKGIDKEAILDLETFSLAGSKMHPIRNAISKSKKLGFTFHIYEPVIKDGIIQKLKQVSDDWLNKPGKTESVFSQGMFEASIIKKTTVLTIENSEEKVVAFLNIVPDYAEKEGTYDLIRISDDAPTGIIYFLLTEMFDYFMQRGITKVNLGMVAFAGIEEPKTMAERSMKFALDNLKPLNHFKGQYMFKEKFNPEWVNKYLVYDSEYDLINFPAALKGVSKL